MTPSHPNSRPGPAKAQRGPKQPPLRLVHGDDDRLTIAWTPPPLENVAVWRLVCWDGDDRAIARLDLRPRRRPRASFTGLAQHAQPFTISISAVGADGTIAWQTGLDEIVLRSDRQTRRVDIAGPQRRGRPGQGPKGKRYTRRGPAPGGGERPDAPDARQQQKVRPARSA